MHSSKDMPTVLPKGLYLSAFLPREDMRDAFIGRTAPKLLELPQGAVVGSASLRRQALIRRLRPDLSVIIFAAVSKPACANWRKAVRMPRFAFAGLKRLGMENVPTDILDPKEFPPARAGRDLRRESYWRHTHGRVAFTYQRHTHLRCRYLRARLSGRPRWFLSHPIAGFATCHGEELHFSGLILTPDGQTSHSVEISGARKDAEDLGRKAGEDVRAVAGSNFFDGWS